MKTVTLRIDVPEEMGPGDVSDMLDDLSNTLNATHTDDPDKQMRASDADWMDEDTGDIHYWNP